MQVAFFIESFGEALFDDYDVPSTTEADAMLAVALGALVGAFLEDFASTSLEVSFGVETSIASRVPFGA